MAEIQRVGDLEIDERIKFQRRQWQIEHVAWAVMTLILVLALAGLFGSGPLSTATVEEEGLSVEYQRFFRQSAPSVLIIEATGRQAISNEVEVWLSANYMDGMEVKGISPQPVEERDGGDRLVYTFAVSDQAEKLRVRFHLQPEEFGIRSGEAGLTGGPTLTFTQFGYP